MKKLLILLSFIIPFIAKAQSGNVYLYGSTQDPNNNVIARQNFTVTATFYLGRKDTLFTPTQGGAQVVRPQDGLTYTYIPNQGNKQWWPFGIGTQNLYTAGILHTRNDTTFVFGGRADSSIRISLANAFPFTIDSAKAASNAGFVINFTGDAGWDLFTRDSITGFWTRIPKGTPGQSLQMLSSGGIGWNTQQGSGVGNTNLSIGRGTLSDTIFSSTGNPGILLNADANTSGAQNPIDFIKAQHPLTIRTDVIGGYTLSPPADSLLFSNLDTLFFKRLQFTKHGGWINIANNTTQDLISNDFSLTPFEINALDYVNLASSDNATVLTNALDSAVINNKVIVLPGGDYNLTTLTNGSLLNVPSNFTNTANHLHIVMQEGTRVITPNKSGNLLSITGNYSDITIEGGEFLSTKDTTNIGNGCILFQGFAPFFIKRVTFKNVTFRNFTNSVVFKGVQGAIFDNCKFLFDKGHDNATTMTNPATAPPAVAVTLVYDSTGDKNKDIKFVNCYFDGLYNNTISNTITKQPMDGMIYGSAEGLVIDNCTIRNFGQEGIAVFPVLGTIDSSMTVISNNHIYALLPTGTKDTNNVTRLGNYGIRADVPNLRITGNEIVDASTAGIMQMLTGSWNYTNYNTLIDNNLIKFTKSGTLSPGAGIYKQGFSSGVRAKYGKISDNVIIYDSVTTQSAATAITDNFEDSAIIANNQVLVSSRSNLNGGGIIAFSLNTSTVATIDTSKVIGPTLMISNTSSTYKIIDGIISSSAQLAAALSDETGTGSVVFSNGPTLTNPIVGTQSANDNSNLAASTAYVDRTATQFGGYVATITNVSGGTMTATGDSAFYTQNGRIVRVSGVFNATASIGGSSITGKFSLPIPSGFTIVATDCVGYIWGESGETWYGNVSPGSGKAFFTITPADTSGRSYSYSYTYIIR